MTSFNLPMPRPGQTAPPLLWRSHRLPAFHLAVAFLVGLGAVSAEAANPPGPKDPASDALQAYVLEYYSSLPDYQPGDVITRSSVEKLFGQLEKEGWTLREPELILDRVLPDDDIIVQQLQTKKGRAFWQRIRQLPDGIDRLDRLARMPQGSANVRDLIQKIPDGYKWIEGMTTTRRGRRMGERLSKSERGRAFNQPTGRIYTAEELLEALPAIVSGGKSLATPAR